jgi:hypothetical protein
LRPESEPTFDLDQAAQSGTQKQACGVFVENKRAIILAPEKIEQLYRHHLGPTMAATCPITVVLLDQFGNKHKVALNCSYFGPI